MRTPEQYHADEHGTGPSASCWRCGKARATCRRKIRFTDRDAADDYILALNIARNFRPPVGRYRCRWCGGNAWHMKTARKPVDVRRAERQRRKWLIRTREERAGGRPEPERA